MTKAICTCQICEMEMIKAAERRGDIIGGLLSAVAVFGVIFILFFNG